MNSILAGALVTLGAMSLAGGVAYSKVHSSVPTFMTEDGRTFECLATAEDGTNPDLHLATIRYTPYREPSQVQLHYIDCRTWHSARAEDLLNGSSSLKSEAGKIPKGTIMDSIAKYVCKE